MLQAQRARTVRPHTLNPHSPCRVNIVTCSGGGYLSDPGCLSNNQSDKTIQPPIAPEFTPSVVGDVMPLDVPVTW